MRQLETGLVCVDVGRIARRPREATRVRHVRIASISVPLTVRGSLGFSVVERQTTRLELALTAPKFLGSEPLFLGCRGRQHLQPGPCDETAQPLRACVPECLRAQL